MKYSISELSKTNRKRLGNEINIVLFRIIRFADLERFLGKGAESVFYYAGKDFGRTLEIYDIEELFNFIEKK